MTSSTMDEHFVRFVGVQKSFGAAKVVHDLNLDIKRGEFITLLGPSGSGKTTCLLMLAGFEALSQGDILVDGRSIGYVPAQKRNIGMVFQSYALFPHMTVAENIAFPLTCRKLRSAEIEAQVKRALAMIKLESFASRLPGQLSGGQQQRVALARALVFQPSLVLMDEPLGALDKQLREEMQYEIMSIQQELGVTVVYVTHDQSEALTMSDRIAVFNAGVIQQLAPPREIYEAPANAFVARFIGENNRLVGKVSERNGSSCAVTLASGARLRARPVNAGAVGSPSTLSVRPERVVLGAAAASRANRFEALVSNVVFHGDHVRVAMQVAGQDGFVAKLSNVVGVEVPVAGSSVAVGWDEDDCHALDVESEALRH